MILGGFDGLDGFLHGADAPVVEFTAGILPALDLPFRVVHSRISRMQFASSAIALVYFCKGSKASANALPIWANIFALPK